jgi:hypothetical protein
VGWFELPHELFGAPSLDRGPWRRSGASRHPSSSSPSPTKIIYITCAGNAHLLLTTLSRHCRLNVFRHLRPAHEVYHFSYQTTMAPNTRKRVADEENSPPSRAKTARLAGSDDLPTLSGPSCGAQQVSRAIATEVHSSLRGQCQTLARRPLEPKLKWPTQATSHGGPSQLPAHHQHQAHGAVPLSSPLSTMTPAIHKPAVVHRPHPGSKLCEHFHWVPYPLGLMPYDS